MLEVTDLVKGNKYNWKNQIERLVYMGKIHDLAGAWYQFALESDPTVVWCEARVDQLEYMEETVPVQKCPGIDWTKDVTPAMLDLTDIQGFPYYSEDIEHGLKWARPKGFGKPEAEKHLAHPEFPCASRMVQQYIRHVVDTFPGHEPRETR